jgi:signal peptidase II
VLLTPMHKKIFILIVLDQITKLIFSSRDFFLGFLHVHPVKNYGLGFGLNFGTLINLIVIAVALVFFIFYYFTHHRQLSFFSKSILALILAGALSNIIDRLYLGYARDFLDIGLGFTFNLADVMIVVGLVLILFTRFKSRSPGELPGAGE